MKKNMFGKARQGVWISLLAVFTAAAQPAAIWVTGPTNQYTSVSTPAAQTTATGLATSGAGDVFLTGMFTGTNSFGSLKLNNGSSVDALYLARYTSAGAPVWAVRATGPGINDRSRVKQDTTGNLIVVSEVGYLAAFTDIVTTNTVRVKYSSGVDDKGLMIAKYTASGTNLWVRNAGSFLLGNTYALNSGKIILADIAVDAAGNTIVAGNFGGGVANATNMVVGGSIPPGFLQEYFTGFTNGLKITNYARATSSSSFNIFVTKFDSNGVPLWARSIANTNSCLASHLSLDTNGNIFICGTYDINLPFGGVTLTNGDSFGNSGFIGKLDSAGNPLWVYDVSAYDPAGGTNRPGNLVRGKFHGLDTDPAGRVVATFSRGYSGNGYYTTPSFANEHALLRLTAAGLLDTNWVVEHGHFGGALKHDSAGNIWEVGPSYSENTFSPALNGNKFFIRKHNNLGQAQSTTTFTNLSLVFLEGDQVRLDADAAQNIFVSENIYGGGPGIAINFRTTSFTPTPNAYGTGEFVLKFGVSPPQFLNGSLARLTNGGAVFTVCGTVGQTVVVQTSSNFVNWVSFKTNVLTTTCTNLTDPAATNANLRFYRAFVSP